MEELIDKIKNKNGVWTVDLARKVLMSNDINPRTVLSKPDEWDEFVYFINQGFLKCVIEEYQLELDCSDINDFSEEIKAIEAYEKLIEDRGELEAYTKIQAETTYDEQLEMTYELWRKLRNRGAENIEIKKRNYSLYAKDLKTMVRVGGINVSQVLEVIKNRKVDIYMAAPYRTYKGSTLYLFSFEVTPAFIAELEINEQNNREILAQFEQQGKQGKKAGKDRYQSFVDNIPYDTSGVDDVDVDDLIVFCTDGIKKTGMVVGTIADGKKGIQTALELIHQNSQRMTEKRGDLASMLGNKSNNSKITVHLNTEGYEKEMLLVLNPEKTSKNVIEHYFAVSKEEIVTVVDFDVIPDVLEQFIGKNLDPTLRFKVIDHDETSYNAAYSPEDHCVLIYFGNTMNLIFTEFLERGILPEITFEMLLVHELGHGDHNSRYLYKDLMKLVKKINQVNLKELLQNGIWYTSPAELLQLEQILIDQIELRKRYFELALQGEIDAYVNGKKYLNENYLELFAERSYQGYLGYHKANEKKMIDLWLELYSIRDRKEKYSWYL